MHHKSQNNIPVVVVAAAVDGDEALNYRSNGHHWMSHCDCYRVLPGVMWNIPCSLNPNVVSIPRGASPSQLDASNVEFVLMVAVVAAAEVARITPFMKKGL